MRPFLSARAFFYILYALFWPFILSLFSLLGLIFIFQFINNTELLLLDTEDLHLSVKFLMLQSLSALPMLISFCLLLGILLGHGKLSSNHELTAFANLGYSKIQISIPAIFLSFICFFICSSSIHTWGPNSKSRAEFLESLLREKLALTALQPGVFLNNLPGAVFYTEEFDSGSKKLKRVFLLTGEQEQQPKFIFSDEGSFLDSSSAQETFQLLLNRGQVFGLDKKNRNFIVDYDSYKVSLFKNQDFDFIKSKPTYITSKRLKRFEGIKYRIEYHKRIVLSLICFLFLGVSLLFSLKLHSRSSSGKGFVFALFLSLVFWVVLFISEYISASQNTAFTMYIPILLFLIIILSVFYWNKSKFVI